MLNAAQLNAEYCLSPPGPPNLTQACIVMPSIYIGNIGRVLLLLFYGVLIFGVLVIFLSGIHLLIAQSCVSCYDRKTKEAGRVKNAAAFNAV